MPGASVPGAIIPGADLLLPEGELKPPPEETEATFTPGPFLPGAFIPGAGSILAGGAIAPHEEEPEATFIPGPFLPGATITGAGSILAASSTEHHEEPPSEETIAPATIAGTPAGGATDDVTIRLQALDGTWETCGADRAIKVVGESLTVSANEWGADKASFDLRRSVIALWPDIAAYSPVEIEIGGIVVYRGRVGETPARTGAEEVLNVQCEGRQYELDDDVYERRYVHARLTDWRDARSYLATDLTFCVAAPTTQTQQGLITLGWPKESAVAHNDVVAVVLDMGPSTTAKRVVVELEAGTVTDGSIQLYARCSETPNGVSGVAFSNAIAALTVSTGTGVHAGTAGTAYRYVTLFLLYTGAGGTFATDQIARIKRVLVVPDTTYEAANQSNLKASTVIVDAIQRATALLSEDMSQVEPSTFDIPDFDIAKPSTPREAIEAANAYHNWITQVDTEGRPVFRSRPSAPLFEIGSWSGATIEDASMNNGAEIYSRALVEAEDPEGNPLRVLVDAPSPTLASRRGLTRTKVVSSPAALTQTEAEQLGVAYLESHTGTPFKGSIQVQLSGVRSVIGGQSVHPAHLLLHTQELLRFSHLTDPDTGAVGRDGTIAEVAYSHKERKATVTLDDRRTNFDALTARLNAAQTVGS